MSNDFTSALAGGLLELGDQWLNTQRTTRFVQLEMMLKKAEEQRKRALEEVKANREQKKYERDRADKLADYERKREDSLADAEIEHGRDKELINYRAANKAPGKTTLQKVRQGDEEVAYLFEPDGTNKEFARGPAFKDEVPGKAEYIIKRLRDIEKSSFYGKSEPLTKDKAEELRETLGNEYDILTQGLLSSPASPASAPPPTAPPSASAPPAPGAPPPSSPSPARQDPQLARIPEAAKARLRADPSLAAQFDEMYGTGAAQQILSGF